MPFWIDTSVSPTAILHAVGLTLFAAAIAGFVPPFKVTSGGAGAKPPSRVRRRRVAVRRRVDRGHRVQLALTPLLPWPLLTVGAVRLREETPAGFPVDAFLTATLEMDRLEGVVADGDTEPPPVRCDSKHAKVRSLTGSDRTRACWVSRTPSGRCTSDPAIGVRVALGAQPRHILTIAFKRPLFQMALGIGVGAILGFVLANDDLSEVHLNVLGNAAVFVLSTILCCALACIVPTRRALRIQPMEALREES